jgi:hypothetical protein
VEVAEDGTAIKTEAKDWPLNPPLVDFYDPLPDQQIDRDESSGRGQPHVGGRPVIFGHDPATAAACPDGGK